MNFAKLYRLTKIISIHNEPWLEKWARLIRYQSSIKFITPKLTNNKKLKLLDMGCGQDILFYKFLTNVFPDKIGNISYVGLDPLITKKDVINKNISIIPKKYEDYFQVSSSQYDIVTTFAVLEHVDDPGDLINKISKLLKIDGLLIGTTPSYLAKPVLEFLSYVLGIISKREIDEHKNYFSKKFIQRIFFSIEKFNTKFTSYHEYFELGLNNLFILRRRR